MGRYAGIRNISNKEKTAALEWLASNPYDDSINSYSWNGETFDNPYALNEEEYQRLAIYMSGGKPWRDSDYEALANAYNKYNSAKEWYAQIQQKYADTDFNSSTEAIPREVEAQHSAGLNPDLIGLSGDSPASGTPVESSLAPAQGISDSGQIINTVNSVFGNIGTLLSAANGIGALVLQGKQISQSIRNQRAEYAGRLLNDILPGVVNSLPESAFKDDTSFVAAFNEDLFTGLGFSKSDYNQSKKWLDSLKRSPAQLRNLFSNKAEFEKFRQQYGELLLSPFRYSDSGDNDVLGYLLSLRLKREIALSYADIAKSNYEAAFNNSRNPQLAGDAADSQNRQVLNSEELQDMQVDYEVAKMRAVMPQILYAADLIASGIPGNVYSGMTILSDVNQLSNDQWSLTARSVEYTTRAVSNGVEDVVDTVSDSRFVTELKSFISSISEGDFGNASFYGMSFNDLKEFFQKIDAGFVDGFNKLREGIKNGISNSSSSNPVLTPYDSYKHFYGR